MGLKMGSVICQPVTDVLRHVMQSKHVTLFNYLDDIICIHRHQNADTEFNMLYFLFKFLGLPVNSKKVVPPSRSLTCIGTIVDADTGQMSIPQSKCLEILDLDYHHRSCSHISKKQLQSLLGKLLYLHRCIIPAGTFVNRLLNKLHQATMPVKVCEDVRIYHGLYIFYYNYGKVMFSQGKPAYDVFVDTCLGWVTGWVTFGMTMHMLPLATFKQPGRGHGGRVVTLSPPTSAAGDRSPSWP